MRFYWFDGKAPQGPLETAELLAQPGFNAETVVCPVGAERPDDWKPAVNYEPLRDALFKPKPVLISPPPPVGSPCSACRSRNPEDAVFCSHCGQNLKEAAAGMKPPPAEALPPGPAILKPPEVSAGPRRGSPQGTMGRLAQQPTQFKVPPMAKPPEARPPAPAPSRPAAAAPALKDRPFLLAAGAFSAAFIVLVGFFFWRRAAPSKVPAVVPDLAPPAAAKLGTQEGTPAAAAAQPIMTPPAAPKAAPAPAAAKPRSPARKPRQPQEAPAPPAEKAPEPSDAELGKLLRDKAEPAQPAAGKAAEEYVLPGIPKKVRKVSDAQPPAPEPAGPDSVLVERAKEQFNFCHQLMRAGNFGDFFDTCLCADARNAVPYKGRKRVFIEKSSQDPASEIGSTAEISAVNVSGETAEITARWAKAEGNVEGVEKWAVEDGLWCRRK
ncbi:MAG: zinc ribbon domain-containing protein [Elusimicrobia bacterium]|nr:zinc ribbon domain-containing protein [Elusimicrobiota bacterium]